MTDWLKDDATFPGNTAAFDRMKDAIAGGDAVAFVGAGASAPTYPVWAPLLNGLIDNAVAHGLDSVRAGQLRMQTHRALYVAEELRKTNDAEFYAHIFETFGAERARPIQTKTHEALMRLAFAAYVTTNHDVGLEEARLAVRPDLASYHDMSAHQPEAEERWRGASGAALSSGLKEILHLHGRFNERDAIVLTLSQYKQAYEIGHRRILNSLWERRGLVLVGYGFADPWIEFIARGALEGFVGTPRHFALIGVDEGKFEDRGYFESTYGVHPVFYPVRPKHDHSALLETLDALRLYEEAPARLPPAAEPGPEPNFPEEFAHQTTDDPQFTGREDVLIRLDDLAATPEVRVVSVTGIGGLGKTALVGHWLKHRRDHLAGLVEGLFYWSFYVDRSFGNLASALFAFAKEKFGWTSEEAGDDIGGRAPLHLLRFLRGRPICLVLDGLEVIQGDRGLERYGMFLDQDLTELLGGLAKEQSGLTLLTSRFPFADLNRFRGLGFAEIQLSRLSPGEGAALLAGLDVGAERDALEEASRVLQGHPLGLRVLAAAARRGGGALPDLARMPDLLGADKFSQKIERLLAFYAEKLTGAERHLTGLVALFPNAVSRTVLTKLTEMLDDPDFLGGPALDGALQALEGDGLLLREPGADAWSAHPVVRDYFRAQGGNAAITAADLVAGRPAEERVKRIDEIRGVLDAIAILCDAGQYVAALSLYNSRCEYGRVFMRLGAMREWYDIASRFTREEALDQLSDREQDRVLNDAAIAGEGYGDLVRAAEMALRAVEISEARKDWTNAAINRSNRAPILSHYRPAAEVVEEAERALALAEKSHAVEIIVVSRACLGVCLAEAGRAGDAAGHAAAAYATARCNPISFDSSRRSFRSLAGNVLFVLGRADLAAALYRDEAKIMARDGYVGDAAWFEACAAGAEGNAAVCLVGLRKTVETARRHGDVRRMSLGYIGISGFLSDLGNAEGAEEAARRAVEIAASRGYMCYHADALAAHAAALAALGRGGAARIVAEDALAIIQPLGNVVVGRKAWRALASAAGVLNDAELETQSRAEAARIDAMLVWPEDVEFPPLDPPEDAK